MSKGYFIEKSRYSIWLILGITALTLLPFIFGIYKTETKAIEVWISLGIVLLVSLLFFSINLKLRIDPEGIQLSFPPFVNKQKQIRWSELSSAYVRRSNPLREYGGWGYRMKYKKRAYTLYGKWGLEITYKDGKSLFIGVQKHEELAQVMNDTIYSHYPDLKKGSDQAAKK